MQVTLKEIWLFPQSQTIQKCLLDMSGEVLMVLKTNVSFPSQFILMSMELIICPVSNKLAFLVGTYFLGFF